jgi:hypothetical protein
MTWSWITTHGDLLLKAVGSAVSLATLIVGIVKARVGLRARLKADLEILKAIDDPKSREIVNVHVEQAILHLYTRRESNTAQRLIAGALGLGIAIGFTWWSVSIVRDTTVSNWWLILTVYGGMIGLYPLFWALGLYDRASTSAEGESSAAPDIVGDAGAKRGTGQPAVG